MIHTCMNPGVARESTIGEPVTREEVRSELGETRRFQLLKKDVKEISSRIGYTPGCKGCKGVEHDYTSRPMHSDTCRSRMEAEMKKTPRGAARMRDYEGKLAEKVEERIQQDWRHLVLFCGSLLYILDWGQIYSVASSLRKDR